MFWALVGRLAPLESPGFAAVPALSLNVLDLPFAIVFIRQPILVGTTLHNVGM